MSFFSKWEQERTKSKPETGKSQFLGPKSTETLEGNTVKVAQAKPQPAPPAPIPFRQKEASAPPPPQLVKPVVIEKTEKPVEEARTLTQKDMYRPKPVSSSMMEAEPATGSVIGAGLVIKGEISGDEDIKILGTVEGTINFDQKLYVGQTGVVRADIRAQSVRIAGEVHGNVVATNKVELAPSGRMYGDIKAPRVAVGEGATFKGRIDMSADAMSKGVMPSTPVEKKSETPKNAIIIKEEAPKMPEAPKASENLKAPKAEPQGIFGDDVLSMMAAELDAELSAPGKKEEKAVEKPVIKKAAQATEAPIVAKKEDGLILG